MSIIYGYHFTADTLRDGRPIPAIGEVLRYEGEVVPCGAGLHCSTHPFDALSYAPGPLLHRVELRGDLISDGNPISYGNPADKWVGRERIITASMDATELLRAFARWCALQVIHLWDAPPVVRQYLETGDEALAAEAKVEARAWARHAAGAAAWHAAGGRAGTTAWEAARKAAGSAVLAVAWVAACKVAGGDFEWGFATPAAESAKAAAGAAAEKKQRDHFKKMVEQAFKRGDR